MPLKDFTEKKWKVIEAEKTALCQYSDEVTFSQLVGLGGEVKVLCNKADLYGKGIYKKDGDAIKGDAYEITMVVGESINPRIHFRSEGSPASGGSWTAEDQGPWPGDE